MVNSDSIVTSPVDEPVPKDEDELPCVLDRFKLARGYVEHENTLIGQRITWFLTCQGLLFTAFFLVAQLPWKDPSACYLGLTAVAIPGAFLIVSLGIGSCVVVHALLALAFTELDVIAQWWRKQEARSHLPERVTGELGRVKAHWFAHGFTIVWAFLLIAFVMGARAEISATYEWVTGNDRPTLAACKAKEDGASALRPTINPKK